MNHVWIFCWVAAYIVINRTEAETTKSAMTHAMGENMSTMVMSHSNGTMSHSNDTMSHGNGTMDHGNDTMDHVDHSMHNHTMDDGAGEHTGHDVPEGGHDMSGGGHGTYFFLSVNSTILFMEWITHSWQTMLGSCVGIGAMAALYEGLKLLREILLLRSARHDSYKKHCCSVRCSCMHLLQMVLHMVQVFVSYCLMMVFMTFNVWLCVAVIAGAGLGYLIFGWRRRRITQGLSIDQSEHCH